MASFWINRQEVKSVIVVNHPGGITSANIYNQYKPDFFINGGHYDSVSMQNITRQRNNTRDSGHLFGPASIAFDHQGQPKAIDNLNDLVNLDPVQYPNYIAGSPPLVIGKKVDIQWNPYSTQIAGPAPDMTLRRHRSFFGFNDTHYILCATDNPMTIPEIAAISKSWNLTTSLAMDGGGSCHLQKGSTPAIMSYRANVSWILFYTTKAVNLCPTCGQIRV